MAEENANSGERRKVDWSGASPSQIVYVQPKEVVELGGLDLAKIRIDVAGADVVFTDLATKGQMVFPGLALFLFDPSSAPTLVIGGAQLDPQALLSKVGMVADLTVRDLVAVSSIIPDQEHSGKQVNGGPGNAPTQSEQVTNDDIQALTQALAQAQAQDEVAMAIATALSAQVQAQVQTQANAGTVPTHFTSPAPADAISAKPPVPDSPSQTTPSTSTSPPVPPGKFDTPPEAPADAPFSPLVDITLVQPARTESYVGPQLVVRGGGGADASFVSGIPGLQYSTEVIDKSAATSDLLVRADNENYYTDTQMARVLQFTPSDAQPGYVISSITVSGFPDGFTLAGGTYDAATHTYTILNPTTVNGSFQWLLEYPTSALGDDFTLSFKIEMDFDPAAWLAMNPGGTVPLGDDRPHREFTGDKTVYVRHVTDPRGYSVTAPDGKAAWVLSDSPNANKVYGGTGNDTLIGGHGDNALYGGGGNDSLYGSTGNDSLDGGAGDDYFVSGKGVATISGGTGQDTADYSATTLKLVVNLGVLTDGFSQLDIDPSGPNYKFDLLNSVENIIAGSGDDTIHGSAADNIITAGGGDDTVFASAGADTLHGGGGVNTVDFSELGTGANGVALALDGANAVTVTVNGGAAQRIDGFVNVVGSAKDDTLSGDAADNTILGGLGNDTISGGDGDDRLDGGGGTDTISYVSATGGVTADLSSSGAANDGSGGVDVLLNFENMLGSAQDDTLTGNDSKNIINGGAGDDVLSGKGGNDTFIASTGADAIDGGSGSDLVDYSGLGGAGSVTVSLNGATPVIATIAGIGTQTLQNVENIIGTSGNDTLYGAAGDNTLTGGSGNDTLYGGAGNNTLDGGIGIDTANYGAGPATAGLVLNLGAGTASNNGNGGTDTVIGIENVIGTTLGDRIIGNALDNTLSGGSGNDTLDGREGNDTLIGGANADTADYSAATARVVANLLGNTVTEDGFGGHDVLSSIENITGGAGDDTLYGTGGANVILGGAGNDYIDGAGDNDSLDGGAGDDYIVARAGANTIVGGSGTDTADYSQMPVNQAITVALNGDTSAVVTVANGVNNLIRGIENIIGTSYADVISGDAAANVIQGGAGDDTIRGGGGSDNLDGGDGNDQVSFLDLTGYGVVLDIAGHTASWNGDGSVDSVNNFESYVLTNQADEVILSAGDDTVDGRSGNDTFRGSFGADTLNGGAGTSDLIDYSAVALSAMGNITVALAGANDAAVYFGDGTVQHILGIENVTGNAGNDTLSGDDGNNVLVGGDGADTISGGRGSDSLVGGSGADLLKFDDLSGSGIVINIANGTASFAGDASTDTFNGFESYVLTNQADTVTLSGGKDIVDAGGGNDSVRAGAGHDVLEGGIGSDTIDYSYYAAATGISVTLNGAAQVVVAVAGGDDATISGFENVVGTAGADTITGDGLNNAFRGGDGKDVLDGKGGNDTLFGEAGDDTIIASDGDDTYDGGGGSDTVDYSVSGFTSIAVTLNGSNPVLVSIAGGASSNTLSAFENITGTGGNDTLIGDSAANTLAGGGGNDTLIGKGGNDRLDGGGGEDLVDYSGSAGAVTVDLGGGSATGEGADVLVSIEDVIGSSLGDTLTGSTARNTISAGGGNDLMIATGGGDTFDGGDGADTVDYSGFTAASAINVTLAGNAAAVVTISGGPANDTVVKVENIIGTAGDDTITGDAENNYLQGMGGADVLSGRTGNDTLDGGAGTDTADYSTAAGAVVANLGSGVVSADGLGYADTLISIENISGGLGDNTFWGAAGTVNSFIGNIGHDTVHLAGDNDFFDGRGGTDTADYSDLSGLGDSVVLALGGAGVTVTATVDGTGHDTIVNVEDVVGSGGKDTITGDSQANVLTLGGGDDTVYASLGADTIHGGAGSDLLSFNTAGVGTHTVNVDLDSGFAALSSGGGVQIIDGIEAFELTGGSDTFTGAGGDDTVWGGGGTDTLSGGAGSDTLDGGNGADIVNGGDDNDLIIGSLGGDILNGGNGDDRLDYSGLDLLMNGHLANGTGTISFLGGGDTISGFESLVFGSQADELTLDVATINAFTNMSDMGDGNDKLIITGDMTGVNLAGHWTNLESVDFTGATNIGAGHTYDAADVQSITGKIGAAAVLNFYVANGHLGDINLTDINPGGDSTVGNTRTVMLNNGAEVIVHQS